MKSGRKRRKIFALTLNRCRTFRHIQERTNTVASVQNCLAANGDELSNLPLIVNKFRSPPAVVYSYRRAEEPLFRYPPVPSHSLKRFPCALPWRQSTNSATTTTTRSVIRIWGSQRRLSHFRSRPSENEETAGLPPRNNHRTETGIQPPTPFPRVFVVGERTE